MNDLCGIDMLPEMRAAGVSCLKIEGRLKSAQYVANTVAAYRMALDSLDEPETVQEKSCGKPINFLTRQWGGNALAVICFQKDQLRQQLLPSPATAAGCLVE